MNTATKVGAFGAGVSLAFGVALGIGNAVGPVGAEPALSDHQAHGANPDPDTDTDTDTEMDQDMNHDGHTTPTAGPEAPGGLQISERGYTLAPPDEPLPAGERTDFRFRILGPDGEPLADYEKTHDKDLHLIVARRDLSGFQHVHPTLGADGAWSVPLTFANAGDHRIFADFSPAGDPDGPLTLGADVAVTGGYRPEPLPEPARTAGVDGYTVTLDGDLAAGADSELTLSVSRDGRPVTDLEPYLGAYGHLVALRSGDLAYLHVHPQGEPGDGETPAGPGITFHTRAPSEGTYRLYLDFQHNGAVRTAEFTVTAGQVAQRPTPGASAGHAH
ncbi:hypothetical protein [Streptomyces sp. SBT349]|uniref:hypothetical protein n=1 Tax=Streptomyces sp. SBT349 TaxID=1580539 RepID=UPI00066D457D|nr:hypothetical protein [Streptomyces sp. SBT349]